MSDTFLHYPAFLSRRKSALPLLDSHQNFMVSVSAETKRSPASLPHIPGLWGCQADQVGWRGKGGERGKRTEQRRGERWARLFFKWGQTEERQGHLVLSFLIIITPHLVSSDIELWGEFYIDYIQKNLMCIIPLGGMKPVDGVRNVVTCGDMEFKKPHSRKKRKES